MPLSSRDADTGGTAVLLLIGLFALLAVGVLSYGVSVYRHLTDLSQETYFQRTALSYFANQIRTFDQKGSVALGQLEDVEAVVLRETWNETAYVTYLYYYEGAIRQLATQADNQVAPENGVPLLEATGLDLSRRDDSLSFTAWSPEGAPCSLTITPRCGLTEEGTA